MEPAGLSTRGKEKFCGPARLRIQPPRTLWQDKGDCDSLGQATECFSMLRTGFMLAATVGLHNKHTTTLRGQYPTPASLCHEPLSRAGTSSTRRLTRSTLANTRRARADPRKIQGRRPGFFKQALSGGVQYKPTLHLVGLSPRHSRNISPSVGTSTVSPNLMTNLSPLLSLRRQAAPSSSLFG